MDQPPSEPTTPIAISSAALATGRRIAESVLVALVTSTSLYLVGSVYVTAYFGRLSIDAASLDLAPPFVALQATHALQGLLDYPTLLLVVFVLARLFARPTRWIQRGYGWGQQRFGRLTLLLVNLVIIAPLVVPAAHVAVAEENLIVTGSVLGEVAELLVTAGILLLGYAVWLSLGPRQLLLTPLRQRRLVPITLLFIAYLLNALITTAQAGELAAEELMAGISDSSLAVVFTPRPGFVLALPTTPLIFVIVRNGAWYAVERQSLPPSGRPVTHVIPADAIANVHLQRITAAAVTLDASDGALVAPPFRPASPVVP